MGLIIDQYDQPLDRKKDDLESPQSAEREETYFVAGKTATSLPQALWQMKAN